MSEEAKVDVVEAESMDKDTATFSFEDTFAEIEKMEEQELQSKIEKIEELVKSGMPVTNAFQQHIKPNDIFKLIYACMMINSKPYRLIPVSDFGN